MSLFGESDEDRRDKTLGLAGLLAGFHSLRILAERGLASPEDIQLSVDGIRAVLGQLPPGAMDPTQIDRLDAMLGQLVEAARAAPGEESQ